MHVGKQVLGNIIYNDLSTTEARNKLDTLISFRHQDGQVLSPHR